MELRVLQYFLAVAKEESITRAAESLHLSQPTLSRQLRELEESLGKQLFIRGNRKITLTEEGRLLRQRAEEIAELVEKTRKELSRPDEQLSGDIYIGAGETYVFSLLSEVMESLRQAAPAVRFHIFSDDRVDMTEKLNSGLIDFGLVVGSFDKKQYASIKLPLKDDWGVLMRKDDPLAAKEGITPADLADRPLIVSHQGKADGILNRWFGKELSDSQIAATFNLVYNASLMAKSGMGYVIGIDRLIGTGEDSGLCFRPLSPAMQTEVSLVWKKDRVFSKAAALFLSMLQEKFGENTE